MSNVKRLLVSDRVFFVTVNLRRGCAKFTDRDYALLAAGFIESRAKLSFYLCGYVFMPDHWHALLGVKQPLTISRAVQDIKWISAQHINRRRDRRGPLWQHQFWDRYVRHEKEFEHRLAYMHLNPVRKGLAVHPRDWIWSSHGNYAIKADRVAECPIAVDHIRFGW